MKHFIFILVFTALISSVTYAQTPRSVSGEVTDSGKMPVAGVNIKLVSEKGDSIATSTNAKGYFSFQQVKGNRLTLTFSSIGYQGLIKHFVLADDNKPANLGLIVLYAQANMLNQVNIVGVTPVTIKEDTVEYKVSAYKVRENAPLEDALRKMPGVDVDKDGNVTAQGKKVSKVRVNGKDFFGGDVRTATQNLPADVVQSVQMIDDYGDQANLTGIKTGEPDKIMNIMIKQDKNHGYTVQATAGDGADALPNRPGVSNDSRYIGLLNAFRFNGDQQIAVLGNVNNTNINTFSFGDPATGPSGGSVLERKKLAADAMQSGGGKGGTGSRGNFSNQTSQQNGITTGGSAGANFRDQWGKHLSVYGSYSFSDNTVNTKNTTSTQNITTGEPITNTTSSDQTDQNINHRLTWNMEYKPDVVNYLKVSPSFSYRSTHTSYNSIFNSPAVGYSSVAPANGNSQGYALTALYNHRFNKGGRNFSIDINLSSNPAYQYQNPQFTFTTALPGAITNQMIVTNSHANNIAATVSYIEPLSEVSWLEASYSYNRNHTSNDKETTLLDSASGRFIKDDALSVPYNYTFTTNNFGLNYRYVQKGKYNFTLGIGAQPSVLDGRTPGLETHKTDWNIVPTAHMVYNFSRNSSLSLNYDGVSSQPAFNQLQPIIDFSSAFYPVQGNPNLKPQFTNNFSFRYNQIDFESGELLFTNLSYNQTHNEVVTNTIIYPRVYTPDRRFDNAYLTQYLNADGFYTASGYISYNKPWDKRKFSLMFSGNITYTHTAGYITQVDSVTYNQTTLKNIAGNLQFTPGIRFRADIPDKMDAQFFTNYSINKTSNSINNAFTAAAANLKTWNIGISGKNYFLKDWTLSYDYSKAVHYGYSSLVNITDPNILNMYVERRFMKGNRATIRLAAFDLFNQNTGFSSVTTASTITQSNTNRLGRYYLATFTMRLQKFAGK
jgi:hypothetical protein